MVTVRLCTSLIIASVVPGTAFSPAFWAMLLSMPSIGDVIVV